MTVATLDLNDRQMAIWLEGEATSSPAYALLRGKNYLFGDEARGQARLHPRDINNRFWWQLDTEALNPAFGSARHTADLVHAHLLDMHGQAGSPEELILVAPGSMHNSQLSLLLGIIQQCPFEAVGLVDRAIASCALTPLEPEAQFVEIQLHQALVTSLALEEGVITRGDVTPIPGCGWLAIQDKLANAIADCFIRQTRFDPRRQAQTEQLLYDALPDLLQQMRDEAEVNFELKGHRARLEREQLALACRDNWKRLIQSATSDQLIAEDFLSLMPGLAEDLGQVELLPRNALLDSIERHHPVLLGDDSGLHFVARLPGIPAPADKPESTATSAPATPAVAPVTEEQPHYRIDVENGICTLTTISGTGPDVNGESTGGQRRLSSGDIVELGNGQTLTLGGRHTEDGP